ncbi:MAG: hypothetical protein JOZ89_03915, partial [Gammaproteobacteria bacterium]|nr:hypothetical protein [Gammaproteobacteria bacterium]
MKAPASPSVSPSEVDLDSTAELPVLDPAEIEEKLGESAGAAHTASDTWILPAGARVAPPRLAEAPAPPPRMAGAPPASKGGTPGGAEVRELQANLHAALAKLRDAEGLAARQAAQLRDLEASRAEALEARRAAEESATALRAELTRREAHAAQRLEQHHAVSSGELARERERLQALTAQAQAHSARLIQDLHLERARSASCLEALQTLESRRQIAESATLELQRQMDSRQGAETELRGRLAGGNNRVRELETELERRATEFGVLERLVGSLETALAVERQRVAELEGERRAAGEQAHAHSPSTAAVAQGSAPADAHAPAESDTAHAEASRG